MKEIQILILWLAFASPALGQGTLWNFNNISTTLITTKCGDRWTSNRSDISAAGKLLFCACCRIGKHDDSRRCMKALSVILSLWFSLSTFAQGVLTFANSPTTLLSANGVPMPVSGEQQFIFAVFLAPSTTVTAINETVSFLDPAFQIVEGYNTNQSATPGRLVTRSRMPTSYTPGSTVDFIVRGWSANAGGTWAEALATWNNGVPLAPMFIGSSTIGNDFFLAGDTPSSSLFGLSSSQVRGFDMGFVPEPTVGSALILAGAVFVRWRRRRDNTNAKSFSLPSRRTSN